MAGYEPHKDQSSDRHQKFSTDGGGEQSAEKYHSQIGMGKYLRAYARNFNTGSVGTQTCKARPVVNSPKLAPLNTHRSPVSSARQRFE